MSRPGTFDARELFRALAHHDVEYVTIGGIAIQAYGGQRLTQDLDIAIASSTANLERLANALRELDARILGPDGQRSSTVPTADLLSASDHWQLASSHGPLDVVTLPAHLGSFTDMRARAHEIPLGAQAIRATVGGALWRYRSGSVHRRHRESEHASSVNPRVRVRVTGTARAARPPRSRCSPPRSPPATPQG